MKRFTETSKWSDPWFRRLSPVAKLLWQYLCDNCSSIGMIDLDFESAAFHIGSKTDDKHLAELDSRIQRIGTKIFIPKFIDFQYGELSRACPAHKPVYRLIEQHGLKRSEIGYQYPSDRVLSTLQDKEKDKDKEKESPRSVSERFVAPTVDEVKAHAIAKGFPEVQAVLFHSYYASNGWRVGKNPMKNWYSAMTGWMSRSGFHATGIPLIKKTDQQMLSEAMG
jgi:hypothetical protein